MAYHYYANPAGAWFVAPFDTQEHLDDYEVPNFYSQIEPPISEGASWVNGAWTYPAPPPAPMPQLKPYQFDAALTLSGLADPLTAAIAAIVDPTTRVVVQSKLKRMDTYDRADPLFNQLGAVIGKSPADIDTIWRLAAAL